MPIASLHDPNPDPTPAAASDQSMRTAAHLFLSSRHFAVAGASPHPSKFGHRIFAWYVAHSLPVTPINPSTLSPAITVNKTSYATVNSVSELPDPTNTGLSFVTQPHVTREVLRQAREAGVRRVWFQPGSFAEEDLQWARGEGGFEAVVGGFEAGTRGGEGWCVLVDGPGILEEIRREKGEDEGVGKERRKL